MKSGYGRTVDGLLEPVPADLGLVSRHVPSLSDEIGDRVLILDERGAPSLELLRFRRALTTFPGFEVALRRRTERLRQFDYPAFGATPAVEYLGEDRGLVLLSSYTPGRRLSEALADAQGPAFAASLIHQLTTALAVLHQYGDGIGHGALTARRIVVSPEGQLIIVEHVLAPALDRLQLSPARMHLELGIPQPETETAARRGLDSRTDFFQLGLIAIALLLGRPLRSDEYPGNLNSVLDQALRTPDREAPEQFRGLRSWLERALQLNGRAFPSSAEAVDALRDIPEQVAEHATRRWRELVRISDAQADGPIELQQASNSLETPAAAPAPSPAEAIEAAIEDSPVEAIEDSKEETMDQSRALWIASQTDVPRDPPSSGRPGSFFKLKPGGYLRLAVVALAFCAIAEAVVIALLLQRRLDVPAPVKVAEVHLETTDPGASVTVDGRSVGVTPLQLAIGSDMRSISIVSQQPATKQELIVGSSGQQSPVVQSPASRSDAPSTSAGSAPQRSGGIRLSSPIELEVFEGDTRLGSSATGIVSAPAGRRELDLVNSVLGFRLRQVVDIKAGQVVPLAVTPPNGIININAVPWAEVLIDGKVIGETPIGNLSLSLGNHEITFRHPQFAELRQTALVRSDTITRVSVNLQR
jgi:hypothetical protein